MKDKVKALGGTWTRDRVNTLKKLREEAVQFKDTVFFFETNEVDTNFAKYLIEYVEGELDK